MPTTHGPQSQCHRCDQPLGFVERRQNQTNGHHNRVMECKNPNCPVEKTLRG